MVNLFMGYRICIYCNSKYNEIEKCPCQQDRRNEYARKYNEENKEQKKLLNSKRWKDLRRIIIKRDGSMCNRCWVQLNMVVKDDLQVHHIKPRNEYPELMFDPNNLITTCKTCNLQMGTNGVDWKIAEFNREHFEPKL